MWGSSCAGRHRARAALLDSVRADGSWPIDTDLATWLTTLAVNAGIAAELSASQRKAIRNWLLDQQFHDEHPFTHAAPGGWAWTDLPGGVPEADDTAWSTQASGLLSAE